MDILSCNPFLSYGYLCMQSTFFVEKNVFSNQKLPWIMQAMQANGNPQLNNLDKISYFHFTNRILWSLFLELHLGMSKLEVKTNLESVYVIYGSSRLQSALCVFHDLFWSCLLIDIKRATLKFHSQFFLITSFNLPVLLTE